MFWLQDHTFYKNMRSQYYVIRFRENYKVEVIDSMNAIFMK